MNKEITHAKATFKTTLNGFLNRLSKLNSTIEDSNKMGINEIYPGNTMELDREGINMDTFQL